MNERLRLYNQKLQDRLATTIEHKVQAESSLASVKMTNDQGNGACLVDGSEGETVTREGNYTTEKKQRTAEGNAEMNEDMDGFVVVPEKALEGSVYDGEKDAKSTGKTMQSDKKIEKPKNGQADVNPGKESAVIKKDPNRPRYTLAEMQQVLEERNRYKERVSMLEDALEAYVPG